MKSPSCSLTFALRNSLQARRVCKQGEVPKQEAARLLGVSEDELQREFAVLRHLEMLRACKKDEGIFLIPF